MSITVKMAGAAGVVIYNTDKADRVVAVLHPIPACHLDRYTGKRLVKLLGNSTGREVEARSVPCCPAPILPSSHPPILPGHDEGTPSCLAPSPPHSSPLSCSLSPPSLNSTISASYVKQLQRPPSPPSPLPASSPNYPLTHCSPMPYSAPLSSFTSFSPSCFIPQQPSHSLLPYALLPCPTSFLLPFSPRSPQNEGRHFCI
ncbi:unnamed protein product, partial [Closterium sp. NIES-54]